MCEPFSLTPALSRWEREKVSQRSKCCGVPVSRTRTAWLPLPEGEGRGEGKRPGLPTTSPESSTHTPERGCPPPQHADTDVGVRAPRLAALAFTDSPFAIYFPPTFSFRSAQKASTLSFRICRAGMSMNLLAGTTAALPLRISFSTSTDL